MGLREKVTLISTTVLIIQITTSHRVPNANRQDALERYLNAKGIKTNKGPLATSSNVNIDKNIFLKKSMTRAFNFPKTEYPPDASHRVVYNLGTKSNTNSFESLVKEVPYSRCKAAEDMKKDMRMKRKLDKIQEHYQMPGTGTTITKSLSGPESIMLTDKETFPEVQYPLNAIETWVPHYWNPPTITQNELEYKPEFPIFSQKVSDKSIKSFAPYKKQQKSKVKQFMEDIDILNENMFKSKAQSKETRDINTKKDSYAIFNNDSINGNFSLLDLKAPSNQTAGLSNCGVHEDFANTSTIEIINFEGLQMELYPTNNLSQSESNILEVIPIPYNIQEENNLNSNSEYENIKHEHNTCKDKDPSIILVQNGTNTPLYSKVDLGKELDLQIPLSMANSSVSPDLQTTALTASITNKTTETESQTKPKQNKNDTHATISKDDPLNVNIPLPELDMNHKTSDRFIKNVTQVPDTNAPRTTIIVVPIDDYVNMMPIPIFERNTDSSIIVFMPPKRKNVTAADTSFTMLNTSPFISETNTSNPDAKAITLDFAMVPNNSMCYGLTNEVNLTNLVTQPFNGTEFVDTILLSEDTSPYYTTYFCATNNSDEASSASLLPNTKQFNTMISLSNQLLNTMNTEFIRDSSLIDKPLVNTTVCKVNTGEELLLENFLKNSSDSTEYSVPLHPTGESLIPSHISQFKIDNSELYTREIHSPFDIYIHNEDVNLPLTDLSISDSVAPVDKFLPEKIFANDLGKIVKVLSDSPIDTYFQNNSLIHNITHNETELIDETSARSQNIIISKDLPLQADLCENNVTKDDSNLNNRTDNSYVNNSKEEPGNKQILNIQLTDSAENELPLLKSETYSGNTIWKMNKNDDELLKNESIPSYGIIEVTDDIQVGSESVTFPDVPQPLINLVDPVPMESDSFLSQHRNLGDKIFEGEKDTLTSIKVNTLQQNENHSASIDISVSNDEDYRDYSHWLVPFSTLSTTTDKNRLPLLEDSENEGSIIRDSDVRYSDGLIDNQPSSVQNTDFENEEQSLSVGNKLLSHTTLAKESDKAFRLVPDGILKYPEKQDYAKDLNDSKALEFQNTTESDVSSDDSRSLDRLNKINNNLKPVVAENISIPPINKHRNDVIENEPLFYTPLLPNNNESLESVEENEGLTGTTLNDHILGISENEAIRLLDSSDNAIHETHTTDITPELIHMPLFIDKSEPDIFNGDDRRLLARNTLVPPESYTKEEKTLQATPFNVIVNGDSLPVDKQNAGKTLTEGILDSEEMNKPLDAYPSEISTDHKPSYMDETIIDNYDDEEPTLIDISSQISPSSNGLLKQKDIQPVTRNRLLVSVDKDLSRTMPSYLIKYLYTAL